MKVILYMAITPNGYIAMQDDRTDFVTPVEWKNFRDMSSNVGNIIIGHRTYDVMRDGGEFDRLPPLTVLVVTKSTFTANDSNHVVVESPKAALRVLEERGFAEALIAGGSQLNGSFMEEQLVDEIYLDVEPTLIGSGIPLFATSAFHCQLELLGTKQLSPNEVQMHYRVVHH